MSTALAGLGHRVRLWAYEAEVAESIRTEHENRQFLPGIKLPARIIPTTDLAEALDKAEFVLTVMPSHTCRSLFERMLPHLRPEKE